MEVMEAPWACRTVMGAQVRRHQTLMALSQLAEARRVFSWLTVMSQISAEWPRSVDRSRPSSVAQIFTRQSSEPLKHIRHWQQINKTVSLGVTFDLHETNRLVNYCEHRWRDAQFAFYPSRHLNSLLNCESTDGNTSSETLQIKFCCVNQLAPKSSLTVNIRRPVRSKATQ